MEVADEVKCCVWFDIQLNLAQTDCCTSIICYDWLFMLKQQVHKKNKKRENIHCPMCRASPLVARKCKFAMKIVKNCIKKCQYWDNYQSILSDVDKHQRTCESNPDRHNTLSFDNNFDEDQFLKRFGDENKVDVAESQALADAEEFKQIPKEVDKHKFSKSTKDVTKKIGKLNLNQYDEDHIEDEPNRATSQDNDDDSEESSEDEDEEEERQEPVKPRKLPPISDTVMILPHLHKHDLYKKKIYNKPSTWICGGYFTVLGCLNTFNCLFKNIDFEFPHYQWGQWEFQICTEWVKYYAENLEKVKFLHRTYYANYHPHPLNLDLGSEWKSWNCNGMSLPNKWKSSNQGEALIGMKRWIWQTCDIKLCLRCIKRKDIKEVCDNIL